MLLSYKHRLYPTQEQQASLGQMLKDFCFLYNCALEQRIDTYRKGRALGYPQQALELKDCRALGIGLEQWSFSAEQQVLRRLDKAYGAFFRRCKAGQKPGFPRFRASSRYHAGEFRVGDGLTLRPSDRIAITGVPGEIKVRWHRYLPSPPGSAIVTRQNGKWFVVFHVAVNIDDQREGETVGIDYGLTSLVALSTGETIDRPNWTKRAAKGLKRRQRALARCKRGSGRTAKVRARLSAYQAKIARKRAAFTHTLTYRLTKRFAGIAIEDLNIKGLAGGMLAKHVHDAAWAQIASQIDYKAEKAGDLFAAVDPRRTSQICPGCGQIAVKTLADRMHTCDCGCVLDRDVAAAMVVHFRAFGFWPGRGRRTLSEPVAA